MSKIAMKIQQKTNGSISKIKVEADAEKYDPNKKYECPDCGMTMFHCKSNKGNYYFSAGPSGHGKSREKGRIKCKYDESNDYEKIYIGEPIINPFTALLFEDSPKEKKPPKPDKDKGEQGTNEDTSDAKDPKESDYVDGNKKITSVRDIFEMLCQKSLNDYFPFIIDKKNNTIEEIQIKEFFINSYTIRRLLKKNLNGPKLLVCSKFNPKSFNIDVDYGEVCFKVYNYAKEPDNNIFLKVKLKNYDANKNFLNDVFQNEEHKDEVIVILADIKKVNKPLNIYTAEITSKCYFWISKDEAKILIKP